MAPLSAAAAIGRAASAGETASAARSTNEVIATQMSLAEGIEATAEAKESFVGERGLLEQLDTIHHTSIESVAARNTIFLNTRNSELAGRAHPETGVRFVKDVVQHPDGLRQEGAFPEFKAEFETRLPDELWRATDYKQAHYCNEQLRADVERDPSLRGKFNDIQRRQIGEGDTPDGFTWHHHQQPGRMQLVDSVIHGRTPHTGGRSIWCGGR